MLCLSKNGWPISAKFSLGFPLSPGRKYAIMIVTDEICEEMPHVDGKHEDRPY